MANDEASAVRLASEHLDPSDLDGLVAALAHFRPRYRAIWRDGRWADAFLEDAPDLVAKMQQSLESREAADLRIAAHSLKSNSADLGAEALRDLCKSAELMGRENQLEGADEIVSQIVDKFEKLETVLNNVRAESMN